MRIWHLRCRRQHPIHCGGLTGQERGLRSPLGNACAARPDLGPLVLLLFHGRRRRDRHNRVRASQPTVLQQPANR
eukprot:942365-Amphidinium_carterae.1